MTGEKGETALEAAARKAGIDVDAARLETALDAALERSGRRIERAADILAKALIDNRELLRVACARLVRRRAAERWPGLEIGEGGQLVHAPRGQANIAAASETNDDGEGHDISAALAPDLLPLPSSPHSRGAGHADSADEALIVVPDAAAPGRDGAGQACCADEAKLLVPRPVAPRRQPSAADIRSMVKAARTGAAVVLGYDTRIAGRPLGEWTYNQIMDYWRRNRLHARDTIVLRLASLKMAKGPRDQPLRRILAERELVGIFKEAEETIDAA